ncbi:hypothetical protein BHM03_00015192, partial [Ensete ventricosum]
ATEVDDVDDNTLVLYLTGGSRNFRVVKSFQAGLQGGMGTAFASPAAAAPAPASFPHYAIQQGLPYYVYGFSPYSAEYNYATSDHQSYYNMYGGAATQYPLYGGAATGVAAGTTGYYPYFQFGQGGAAAAYPHQGQGYGMQYPQMLQYSAMTTTAGVTGFPSSLLHGAPVSLAMSPTAQAGFVFCSKTGMTMALTAPTLPNPTPHHYRHIPAHFAAPTAPEQPLA